MAEAAFWCSTQVRKEHVQTLQKGFFNSPTEIQAELSIAILFGNISQKTSYETGQTLVRQWQRYRQTAERLGWKTLAILSFSASFRQHALIADGPEWDIFFLRLRDLKISIQLAGDFVCSDWRKLLDLALGESVLYLKLNDETYHGHHHLWAIPIHDKKAVSAQPVKKYEVLEKSIYSAATGFLTDPRIIKDTSPEFKTPGGPEEACPLCMKLECECPSHIWFPCRTELIQTKDRGVGVRALQVSISQAQLK